MTKQNVIRTLTALSLLPFSFFLLILPFPVLAFTPHYLVSDAEFTDSTAWSLKEIREFIETKQSPLASYAPKDVDGTFRKAAEIITIAARKHRINPKVLLVILQKEQSLVEGEIPRLASLKLRRSGQARDHKVGIRDDVLDGKIKHRLNWATGYGVCDDCRKSDPRLAGFRGFANQVDFAAQRLRYFLEHPLEFRVRQGKPTRIDKKLVTPLTRATAALYLYTPHIAGNRNFWIIWNRWFAQLYPENSILKNQQTNELWYITKGARRNVASGILRDAFGTRGVITVSADELLKYREGKPITAAPFAVVRDPTGSVWLLLENERRRIADRDVLRTIGFNPEEIEPINQDALQEYAEGAVIRDALSAATIRLIKTPTSRTVYLLDQGKRRPFQNAQAFLKLGYQWNQVLTVADDIMKQSPLGDPIDVATEDVAKALEEFHGDPNEQKRSASE